MEYNTIIMYGTLGFLVFLGLGWHILIGYELIRKTCQAYISNENVKNLEDKIISKSYLSNSIEKLTTMAVVSMFLFEIEKYRYSVDVGYSILFLITLVLYNIPSIRTEILSTFVGASFYVLIVWIFKIRALNQFNKAVSID